MNFKNFNFEMQRFEEFALGMVTIGGFSLGGISAVGLSGPNDCTNVHIPSVAVSLYAEAFAGSEGLTVTGNPYKFDFVLARSVCANGVSGGSCFGGPLKDVKFYGSDKSEKITNVDGSGVYIDGGAGDDIIIDSISASDSTIDGGTGDDKIFVNGSSALVDGGEGNDIVIVSGDNATVDVSTGTDLISIGAGVTNISVVGFESSDQISFTENITSISGISNGVLVQLGSDTGVTVMGLSFSEGLTEEDGKWEYGELPSADVAGTSGLKYVIHDEANKGNAFFNGTDLHVDAGSDASKDQVLVEIAGVSAVAGKTDYFSPANEYVNYNNDTIKTINITSPIITSGNSIAILSNDGNYAFKIDDEVSGISFYGLDTGNTIINDAKKASIYGSYGNDYIENTSANAVFIESGMLGNDTLINDSGEGVTIKGSSCGTNTIFNEGSGCVLIGGENADTIENLGVGPATIDGGDGNDSIVSTGMNSSINGGDGFNIIVLLGDKSTVEASQGFNNISISGAGTSIKDLYVGGFSSGYGKNNCINLDEEIESVEYKVDDDGEEYSKFNLVDKTYIRIYGLDELTHDNVRTEEGWVENSNGSWTYYGKEYEDVGTTYKNNDSGGSIIYYQPATKKK